MELRTYQEFALYPYVTLDGYHVRASARICHWIWECMSECTTFRANHKWQNLIGILYEAFPTLSFSFSASMNMSWYMDLFDEIIFIQFMNDSLDYVKMNVYYFWTWSIFTNSSHQYMHCYGLFESLSAYSSKEVKLT